MSCERFRRTIAAHAAGAELDPGTARHVEDCARCRQLLDRQRAMLAELDAELERTLSISAAPAFVAQVVRATRDTESVPARRWLPAPIWAGLGMAAAIMLAVWVSQQRSAPDSTRPADVGRTAADPAPAAAFGLKAEAPQSQGKHTPAPGTITQPRATATTDCVASGLGRPSTVLGTALSMSKGRKAAAGGCFSVLRSRPPDNAAPGQVKAQDPPVLVDPARALAIQRLRELMTEGRLDGNMLPPPVTPESAFAELTIAPLEVADIRVPDVEIAGRPSAAPERQ